VLHTDLLVHLYVAGVCESVMCCSRQYNGNTCAAVLYSFAILNCWKLDGPTA